MLGTLSVRNAKRQFRDYTLYLVTLISVSYTHLKNIIDSYCKIHDGIE